MSFFNNSLKDKVKQAEDWYKLNFGVALVDWEIFNYIFEYFISSKSPTVEDVEKTFCVISCPCELEYDTQYIIEIKKECLRKRGCFYTCQELVFVYEYYYLHRCIPSNEELEEIIKRYAEFTLNPEDFHQKDKIHVPALNLDKLSPIVKDTSVDENCSLCQEQIGTSSFYKLPPCNHIFHANAEKCLGTSTIIDWLSKNNFCPNCKSKVQITV